jgi:hypothetical protein
LLYLALPLQPATLGENSLGAFLAPPAAVMGDGGRRRPSTAVHRTRTTALNRPHSRVGKRQCLLPPLGLNEHMFVYSGG